MKWLYRIFFIIICALWAQMLYEIFVVHSPERACEPKTAAEKAAYIEWLNSRYDALK